MASKQAPVQKERTRKQWFVWLGLLLAAIALAAFLPVLRKSVASAPAAAPPTPKPVNAVACVGRIEPLDGLTRVGAPYVAGHPAIVAELRVHEGQQVRKGDMLASLDGRAPLEAAMRQAEARIALAITKIEQSKAPPKSSDVTAQQVEIARLQAAYEHSQAEYRRYEALHQKRDVSTSDVDARRAEMENDAHLRDQAAARLKSLSEIRPEDVRIFESELAVARVDLERSRVELASTVVRSPSAGKVMHIRARAGEEVGPSGLLELVQTDSMGVIAEVYETDLGRVHVGQKATVSGELLHAKLQGTVAAIGSEIGRAEMSSGDAAAFADSRVVHVRITLPDSAALAGLIHGKVTVVMEP